MKTKRVISILILTLFTSLLQNLPGANAAVPSGVSNSTSCSSGNATVSFYAGSNGGLAITSWEYSFDGSSYATIPGASGNSGSYSVTSWYSSSFAPYIRARNSDGVSSAARNSSCGSINGRTSYTPTVLAATAPTGNAGSGQVLTSALTFNSQAVAVVKTYKWQRCSDSGASNCVDISGATSATYTAGASDAGMYLRTVVTGTSTVDGVSQSAVGTSALTAQISEAAPGTPGTPTAVAGDEQVTISVVAPSSGGSPASYTVTALDNSGNPLSPAKTCTVAGATGSCVISGLTNGAAYKFSSTATNGAGTSSESAASLSATPTTPPPSITNVTSSTANGSYKAGDVVSIQVTFSQAVTVTGAPQLTLETGSTDQILSYTSGTGTNTLTFSYTIQAGDTSNDLTYIATNPLALNSGTIKNSSSVDAMLTLPSPTASGSLGANKAIVVDTTAPSTPSTPDLDATSDSGSSATDNVTSDNTPTINVSGTFSGTAVVTATKAGSTSVICTITSNACTLATLAEGTWDISVTDTDAAGNATTSTALSITVDTTAPTAGLTAGSILSSENATVTSSAVGTAYLVNSAITVTNLASITGAADSSWNSVAITTANTSTNLAATGLTPGTYRLYTADAAGNLSAVSTNSVTVTLAATGTPDLVAGSDLGTSSTDNTTGDDTPEISISGLTIGAVITLTATPSSGTAVVCTFTATATTGTCPFTTLANGTYSVVATQTFNSVTSSASTALTGLVINKTTIATPSTPDLDETSDSGSSATDDITSDNTPKINVSGSFSGTAVVTATKAGSASVSCTISSNTCTLASLADGTWSISVTDTDSAGNATTSVALSMTVDATAPTPTVATASVTTASGVLVRSSEVGTAYLVKTTVTVTNLASITGAADNSMNQVAISAAGTDTAMSTDGLLAGDYKLYVVDAAGNLSLASTNTVTVAVAAAPTATSTSAPTGTTTFGSTLTNAVTFAGVPTPTQLNYQWKSCTSATDTVCTDIAGATGSSFIANAIDLVGKFIRVLVTAINGISPNGSALSSPTAAITAIAPGVPTVGTPTVGDLQISVPFTAPTSNGGSEIIKYQYSTDGGVTWSDRTDLSTVTSPIVIQFLSTDGTTPIVAGTTYPIQIRAVNSASSPVGLGTASVSVKAVTTPGAPTAVIATATGETTATVSFTAPTNNGGSAITTYTVTSSPGGITASGSTSPILVTGLSASTTYTFKVTANNGTFTSVPSAASSAITTSSSQRAPGQGPGGVTITPPTPAPVITCDELCVAAAKAIVDAAAKSAAEKAAADAKIASDAAAKVVADRIAVDKSAAEAAAKAAVEKAVAAAVAKAAADAAAVQAALVAKAAAEAQLAAVVAAEKAAAALKSETASVATKAAATVTATKAATVASNTVQAAATAAKVAATAKTTAANAAKQVDIAIGALGSKTAAAATAAQANAIAAAAKTAANEAAKVATDQAAAAKVASNNAIKEAANAAARIATEQKEAADAAAAAKVATDLAQKATEEKIAAAAEAQKAAEAVVKALEEKIALADASVKAQDIAERTAIDKKIEEITAKVADAQRVADAANDKAVASVVAQEQAQTAAIASTQQAVVQATEAVAVRTESVAKSAVATKAAADAALLAKAATAAVVAAAKVPTKAVIAPKPSTPTKPNSAKATITGLKPGQKVKVTVNVKGK